MAARRAPFGHLLLPAALAATSALAATVWVVVGDALPGGRWVAVHLFTLGVVTPLIAAFTVHFAATVLHVERPPMRWVLATLVAGAVGVLVGLPAGMPWLVAGGATVASAAVFLGYLHLRRMRKRSLGARFGFVVRAYERAHGAFLHGALLGAILGVGILPGDWYGGVRLAHLHVNVLGWAGVTLLATVVFFGPTVFRVRIEDGAERTASRALRWVASGVTAAAVALILTGFGGVAGQGFRITAGLLLVVVAGGVLRVVWPVVTAARGAKTSFSTLLIRDACLWFAAGVTVDAVAVATGALRWLDVAGLAVLVGGLATAIVGALTYLGPMLRVADPKARNVLRERVEAAPRTRAGVVRAGVALLVLAAGVGTGGGALGAVLVRIGWGAFLGSVLVQIVAIAWPVGPPTSDTDTSRRAAAGSTMLP